MVTALRTGVPGSSGLEITYAHVATVTSYPLRTFYRLTRLLQLA